MRLARRQLLHSGGSAALLTLLSASPLRATTRLARRAEQADRPELAAALQAAAWIHQARIVADDGITWAVDPDDTAFNPTAPDTQTLYSHGPGVLLFLLELYRATAERGFLDEARRGADHLAGQLPVHEQSGDTGLYIGMSGIAYALEIFHQVSGECRYRDAARRYIEAVSRSARISAGAAEWGDFNDVVYGAAGTALTLQWWADLTGDRAAQTLARQSGRGLLARAERTADGGLQWKMGLHVDRIMPNFSHGTAGVGYGLARLHERTGERDFLAAAMAAARHLQALANTQGGGCKVSHHLDDAGLPSDLYYWSWCHGPVGTWRLFHQLSVVTRDSLWADRVHHCARAVLDSGIPEMRLPGFWNNVGGCCGNAGVGAGFLDLYEIYRRPEYLLMVERAHADLMKRAIRDERGLRWLQAENRTEPDRLRAQTGFMQGAAGIGTWLLRLDGRRQGRSTSFTLPDSPFVRR